MAIVTNDFTFNMELDSPNPTYKSFMNVHGWLEKENTYSFDTKVYVQFYYYSCFIYIYIYV